MSHAILSASASYRWINCPPSVRLSEEFTEKTSEYALEGTNAHQLCENKLKRVLGMDTKESIHDLDFYNDEMEECAEGYVNYVFEIISKYEKPLVLIEERLDLSKFAKDSFGTADCIILGDRELHIIDYKHGQGILVDAENNSQLMLYSLGALNLFDDIYDIETVTMHIYQPRRENISVFTRTPIELYKWAKEVIKPKAELAYKGEGEYKSGEWCRFCKAKNTCRKRVEVALEIAKEEFKFPPLLSDSEIEEILEILDQIDSWSKDIKDYALGKALEGKKWKNYKLVEGRSNRKYVNEEKVADIVIKEGLNPYEEKLLGITAMTKLLGKERFNELLSDLLEKPKGKPTLVSRSDKREEIETVKEEFYDLTQRTIVGCR
ncbi:DUF2800 domain-containing protein [Miniphocaeibacter massiliensis]|uniref:DUF2800 domain-containing protein n=1 Tax=Miniphocaeibacter massiliensis TaxID=2041841 RepID=UPI000C1BBEA0|nr:DUF2800 domain-containing protein [Miniphocaeibacter massiliensis]